MKNRFTRLLFYSCAFIITGCDSFVPEPGIGKAIDWSDLAGWEQDRHAESWAALIHNCTKLRNQTLWTDICSAAEKIHEPSDEQAKQFYETWFLPHLVYATGGERQGLITGYYEPLLFGSLQATKRFKHPIYKRPDDLLTVDLSELFPELEGKLVRGRREGNIVIPYLDRAQLSSNPKSLAGQEILWVDDPIAVFFLHIQGSGRVQLPDGKIVGLGYADQNGHPYRSIGRELVKMGELEREEVNLFSIRDWLRDNPHRVDSLLSSNPSYVFFTLRELVEDGPIGALSVPLTAERSIAVDRKVIPLGTPVWLETTLPSSESNPYRRLVLAQDTGGAISGHVRADLFWGQGAYAEKMAGLMKQKGKLVALLPKPL